MYPRQNESVVEREREIAPHMENRTAVQTSRKNAYHALYMQAKFEFIQCGSIVSLQQAMKKAIDSKRRGGVVFFVCLDSCSDKAS